MWRFCQDFRGLNAIKQRSVKPLPHVEQLVGGARGACFSPEPGLESACMKFRIRDEDQLRVKTSSRVPGGQCKFGTFGSACIVSSALVRYVRHSIDRRPDAGPPMLGRFGAGLL